MDNLRTGQMMVVPSEPTQFSGYECPIVIEIIRALLFEHRAEQLKLLNDWTQASIIRAHAENTWTQVGNMILGIRSSSSGPKYAN